MTVTDVLPTLSLASLKGELMKILSARVIASLALITVTGITAPAVAYASSPHSSGSTSPGFLSSQQQLEAQLAGRLTRLQHIDADVGAATSLSAFASSTLQARLSTEESSINSLIAKVPTDTTRAQLQADRAAMVLDNRVYAVMSPQVFESIEASVVASQVVTMQGNESTLQTEVASLTGLPGYQNALNHFNRFVERIANWSQRIATVEAVVLAQTPQGYPRNTNTFVAENHAILNANIAIAYANYDASIIGLAAGGYTGS